MKRKPLILAYVCFALTLTSLLAAHANNQTPPAVSSANQSAPIPMDQLGAVAGKQYQGDGLSVIATPDGASLRCAFQRLEGQVTREGLWLSSTADNNSGERFRVMAMAVGRATSCAPSDEFGFDNIFRSVAVPGHSDATIADAHEQSTPLLLSTPLRPRTGALRKTGLVTVTDNVARFIRPGLTEEYTVSVDGVRQDFIIEHRLEGDGELRVELDVAGAKAEPLVNGARLVLEGSGRKLAYNRLRVTDATGRELPARMEVTADRSDLGRAGSPLPAAGAHGVTRPTLAVLVDDAAAIYPVRIDPTFSDADWISMGGIPGTDGIVYAMAYDGFGNLYVGGQFTMAGDVFATNIAKWNGSVWSSLSTGLTGSKVSALNFYGANLVAGGNFKTPVSNGTATNIARWDGINWSVLGSGVNGTVNGIAAAGSDLYAGGLFSEAGGTPANNIAKWNGITWSPLGSGVDGGVSSLALSTPNLYVGGGFSTAGGTTANRIAKWDGSNWSSLGSGMAGGFPPSVNALVLSGSNLFVGGSFTSAGGVSATNIAKWNGNAWSALGSGVGGGSLLRVYSIGVSGNDLYAGGNFITAGGQPVSGVAKWNGSAWTALGSGSGQGIGAGNYAYCLAVVSPTVVFVGGDFTLAGGKVAYRIANWTNSSWSILSRGLNGSVNAFALSGTNLFIGGDFTMVGDVQVNCVAKWSGTSWSPVGLGVTDISGSAKVNSLAILGSDLYVGGFFTSAGGISANRVAKWNGAVWSALGTGMNGSVNAFTIHGGQLCAGGGFSTAGGMTVNYIARWNGATWSGFGAGIGDDVLALVSSGTDLYAGGVFLTAGGISTAYIAKWNGITWSPLGSGVNNIVRALAVTSSNLVYAGGDFTSAGGISASRIAAWNGSAWLPLGGGVSAQGIGAYVSTLAMSGPDLYAGGTFNKAGTNSANQVAQWNGNNWSSLGSGLNSLVNTLLVSGKNLFVGGTFTTGGGKISAYAAKAEIGIAPGRFTNATNLAASGFTCTFLDASVGQPYRIQTSPSLAAGSWTDFTNFTYTAPIVITVPIAGNTNRFFRAITP